MSLREFTVVTGLYTEAETRMLIYTTAIYTADNAVVSTWWPRIGDEPFVCNARVTRIRDPPIRETVQPCTVFGGVFCYLLPPAGEREDLPGSVCDPYFSVSRAYRYIACKYGGCASSSIRSQDDARHAYRAKVPRCRPLVIDREGHHLAAGAK
ncbi:hypothetical protein R6Q59_034767 [Mikania micrantha]